MTPNQLKAFEAWREDFEEKNKCTINLSSGLEIYEFALQHNAAEVERLRETLQFVERWANHHGQKDCISPAEALSCIQHYPPILETTRGYADGKVPDTPNPWAEVERLTRELAEARNAALEEAKAACKSVTYGIDLAEWKRMTKHDHNVYACLRCADAIDALKSKEPATPTEQEG